MVSASDDTGEFFVPPPPYAVRALDREGRRGRLTVFLDCSAGSTLPERKATVRGVAYCLRHWRTNVCDAPPDWMWPGDYLTVRFGPNRWLAPGQGGYCPMSLPQQRAFYGLTRSWDRFWPQQVYVRLLSWLAAAHEVCHMLGLPHWPGARNLMSSPIGGMELEPEQVSGVPWATANDFCTRTPAKNQFAAAPADAGWVIEDFNEGIMKPGVA